MIGTAKFKQNKCIGMIMNYLVIETLISPK